MAKIFVDSWVMATVSNIKKTAMFYQKLGLKPSVKRPYYIEYVIPGGTTIGLHVVHKGQGTAKNTPKKERDGKGWGIMLRVQHIERKVADLKRKKIDCTPIIQAPGGAYVSYFSDPDGNRFVLLEM